MESVLEHVHGASSMCTGFIPATVSYTEIAFSIGGSHAKYTGDPAPEDSTGTTKGNCSRNTYDITGTERCGKCSGQCGKNGKVILVIIFSFKGHPDGFPGFSLRKMEVKGKEQMCSHKQKKEGTTP